MSTAPQKSVREIIPVQPDIPVSLGSDDAFVAQHVVAAITRGYAAREVARNGPAVHSKPSQIAADSRSFIYPTKKQSHIHTDRENSSTFTQTEKERERDAPSRAPLAAFFPPRQHTCVAKQERGISPSRERRSEMPLGGWCAKLKACSSGDPERIVVPQQDQDHEPHLLASGTRGSSISSNSNRNSNSGGMLDSATSLEQSHLQSQPTDKDDDDDDEMMMMTSSMRLSSLMRRRPRVPTISATSLYNKIQTTGVVVVDCRDGDDFALRHLQGALNCAYVKGRKKTVDDVIELNQNKALTRKMATRDLMEVVVIGANRSSAAMLYKMDWGYRFARMLIAEGRVHSVKFMAQGFPLFARKYDFLLQTRPSICVGLPTPQVKPKEPHMQYPNEIVDGFLFLGNFWQANSAKVVAALKITHVVNMGAITEDRDKFGHVEYFDVDILDNVDVDIRKEFEPTIAFIERAAREHGRVLIHCVQGVSRSSTIVIWYIMVTTKCTLSAAYAHVLKCRPLIFPNHGFMQQLVDYETELYGCASVTLDDLELLQHGLLPPTDRAGSVLRESFM